MTQTPAIVSFPAFAIFFVASSLYRTKPWAWWRHAGRTELLVFGTELVIALLLAWFISAAVKVGVRLARN